MLNLRQTALLILRLSPRRTNKSFDASRRGSEARMGEPAMEKLPPAEYDAILRSEFWFFAQRCFAELNPQAAFATNWHLEVIAAKLTAVREGRIRRLIINLPPRHLKSLLASIAFPAWCLGHDPSAQILCVSYAQDLADKLARDCRTTMISPWYRRIFPTRLAPQRQAVQEFITTRQGYRLATSTGGVLTGREGVVDGGVHAEKPLGGASRLEALHLALSSSHSLM